VVPVHDDGDFAFLLAHHRARGCARVGALAANSSILMFCFGMPAPAASRRRLHHVFRAADEGGVDVLGAIQCCRNCAPSAVMRPLNSSMSCCSRLIT
jgi:hypothetical protein